MVKAFSELGNALLEALKGLLGSKKVLLAVLSVLSTAGAKYGLNLDPTQVAELIGPLWLALLGQGIADHGKAAAELHADAHLEAARLALSEKAGDALANP